MSSLVQLVRHTLRQLVYLLKSTTAVCILGCARTAAARACAIRIYRGGNGDKSYKGRNQQKHRDKSVFLPVFHLGILLLDLKLDFNTFYVSCFRAPASARMENGYGLLL